jgi:ubiquinone/menaquinone biosynthesis C-methylase UbiE
MTSTSVRKPYKGIGMEGFIARWYARNTAGDLRDYRRVARGVAAQVPAGGSVLEVAPGPGYLALEIAKLGRFRICGLDVSRTFVQIASDNARAAGADIDFRLGDAAHMPFGENEFDFVVCRAAFKNFADPVGALDEIHRVLRPGGKASIFDLRKDATHEAIDREVAEMKLSPLNRWLTRWTFRHMLIPRAYGDAALREMTARTRFGSGEIAEDGVGFELRLAKLPA